MCACACASRQQRFPFGHLGGRRTQERFWIPLLCASFSLCVRPWDDILLVTVLKGQNVTGIRKQGKEKQMLIEDLSVILLRSELLQQQKRSKETVVQQHTCSKTASKTSPSL